jgi:CRP-like cAMP-binding protein
VSSNPFVMERKGSFRDLFARKSSAYKVDKLEVISHNKVGSIPLSPKKAPNPDDSKLSSAIETIPANRRSSYTQAVAQAWSEQVQFEEKSSAATAALAKKQKRKTSGFHMRSLSRFAVSLLSRGSKKLNKHEGVIEEDENEFSGEESLGAEKFHEKNGRRQATEAERKSNMLDRYVSILQESEDGEDENEAGHVDKQLSLEQRTLRGRRTGFITNNRLKVSIPFFDSLDLKAMKNMSKSFNKVEFKAGSLIAGPNLINNGANNNNFTNTPSSGHRFFVLVRGRVRVWTKRPFSAPFAPPKHRERNSRLSGESHFSVVESKSMRSGTNLSSLDGEEEITLAIKDKGDFFSDSWLFHDENSAANTNNQPKQLLGLSSIRGFTSLSNKQRDHLGSIYVTALEDCILFCIDASQLEAFSLTNPSIRTLITNPINSLSAGLNTVPFFSPVPEWKLQLLAPLFEWRSCKEGETVIKLGDEAAGFYFIVSGQLIASAQSQNTGNSIGASGLHLATMKAGDWFGEVSLMQRCVRTATLTSIKSCEFLYLSPAKFHTFLSLAPEMLSSGLFQATLTRRTANSLKSVPLFAFIRRKELGPLKLFDEKKICAVGELFSFQQYSSGAIICAEGEEADAFYIIHKGSVAVKARPQDPEEAGNCDSTGNLMLGELHKHDFIGEMGLVCNTRRTATVVALSQPVVLFKLLARDFRKFLYLVPEIKHTLDRVMSNRITATLSHIPFFKQVKENKPWSKLGIFGSMFHFQHYRDQQSVYNEGDPAEKFFIIVQGTVKLESANYNTTNTNITRFSATQSKRNHAESQAEQQNESIELESIGKNQFFGELELIKRVPIRITSAKCSGDCLFLTITKDKFSKFLQIATDLQAQIAAAVSRRLSSYLKSFPFFAQNIRENKPWSKFELLASLFNYEFAEANTTIIQEETTLLSIENTVPAAASGANNSPTTKIATNNHKFYVLANGLINISSKSHTAISVNRARKGAFFNEFPLLRGTNVADCTVVTLSRCIFFTLTKEKFNQFLKVANEFRNALKLIYPEALLSPSGQTINLVDDRRSIGSVAAEAAASLANIRFADFKSPCLPIAGIQAKQEPLQANNKELDQIDVIQPKRRARPERLELQHDNYNESSDPKGLNLSLDEGNDENCNSGKNVAYNAHNNRLLTHNPLSPMPDTPTPISTDRNAGLSALTPTSQNHDVLTRLSVVSSNSPNEPLKRAAMSKLPPIFSPPEPHSRLVDASSSPKVQDLLTKTNTFNSHTTEPPISVNNYSNNDHSEPRLNQPDPEDYTALTPRTQQAEIEKAEVAASLSNL